LMTALGHRDRGTAAHSQRVAELCLKFAKDFVQPQDLPVLEAAALLHDIGKLGVPDAILQKPGPLTADEWMLMRLHARMGVEIVTAAFGTPALTEIVAMHHAHYAGGAESDGLPRGTAIPLAARILAIADAYDAMTSDRP